MNCKHVLWFHQHQAVTQCIFSTWSVIHVVLKKEICEVFHEFMVKIDQSHKFVHYEECQIHVCKIYI